MTISKRTGHIAAFALLALCSAGLGGCGSMIADLPVVGLPADAPARPAEPRAFLPVHDVPVGRDTAATMSAADQAKLQAELVEARARSTAAAAAK